MVRADYWVERGTTDRLTTVVHVVVSVSERHRVTMSADTPHPNISLDSSVLGVPMVLLEWAASAAGWTLGTIVDVVPVMAPARENFAVRMALIE